jgi:segregation and condensation protein A
VYKIKLQNFEGPLDLLLFLIRKNEVDIYDIPIALITRQYLETIELLQQLDLDIAGEFIVMAATLMRIKSQMLIPRPVTEEDEDSVDPRQELINRLLEYRKFKEIAYTLAEKERYFRTLQPKAPQEFHFPDIPAEQMAPGNVTIFDLLSAFNQALRRFKERPQHQVIVEQVSVEEQIEYVRTFLQAQEKTTFLQLVQPLRSKMRLLATFLAILEMIKLHEIIVKQPKTFGEIWIFRPDIQN